MSSISTSTYRFFSSIIESFYNVINLSLLLIESLCNCNTNVQKILVVQCCSSYCITRAYKDLEGFAYEATLKRAAEGGDGTASPTRSPADKKKSIAKMKKAGGGNKIMASRSSTKNYNYPSFSFFFRSMSMMHNVVLHI